MEPGEGLATCHRHRTADIAGHGRRPRACIQLKCSGKTDAYAQTYAQKSRLLCRLVSRGVAYLSARLTSAAQCTVLRPGPFRLLPAGLEQERPWLKPVTAPVPGAALEPPEPSTGSAARGLAEGAGAGAAGAAAAAGARASAGPTRMRPLIYVYDMPPEFTTRMLQYSLNA